MPTKTKPRKRSTAFSKQYTVFEHRGVWYVQFRDEQTGRWMPRRSLKIRRTEGYTVKHAENLAVQWIAEGKASEQAKSRKNTCTFSSYIDGFFDAGGRYERLRKQEGRTIAKSTLAHYKGTALNFIDPFLGHLDMGKIKKDHILAFRTYLVEEKKLSATTGKHVFTTLKILLNTAVEEHLIAQNPVGKICISGGSSKKRSPLAEHEIVSLLSTPWRDERCWLITFLCAATGCRRGEALALQWRQIDLKAKTVAISASWSPKYELGETKTVQSHRIVCVPDALCTALKAWREKSPCSEAEDFVFTSTIKGDRPLNPTFLNDCFRESVTAGVVNEEERVRRGLTFHSLRHSVVTILHNHNVPPYAVMAFVGHSVGGIHSGYYHGADKIIRKVQNKIFKDIVFTNKEKE